MVVSLVLPNIGQAHQTNTWSLTNAASCIDLKHNLRFGSRDRTTQGEVSKLQRYLIAKGYLISANGKASGYYGVKTVDAVKMLQKKLDIDRPSGYMGSITRKALKNATCSTSTLLPPTVPGCPPGALYNYLTGAPCSAPIQTIKIISPDGGERFLFDSANSIENNATQESASPYVGFGYILVKNDVELGSLVPLENASISISSFQWQTGKYKNNNGQVIIAQPGAYKIRMYGNTNSGRVFLDETDGEFNLVVETSPSVVVSSPQYQSVYKTGTTMPITWKATNVPDNVNIILLDPRGGWSSYTIATNIPASQGLYQWTIPTSGGWFENQYFFSGPGSYPLRIRVTPFRVAGAGQYAEWDPVKTAADSVIHGDSKGFAIASSTSAVGLEVVTSTFYEKYIQGDLIEIFMDVYNRGSVDKTINLTDGCKTSYKIGKYDSLINQACTRALTSYTIPANGKVRLTQVHDSALYPLPVGIHTVTGNVFNVGSDDSTIGIYAPQQSSVFQALDARVRAQIKVIFGI